MQAGLSNSSCSLHRTATYLVEPVANSTDSTENTARSGPQVLVYLQKVEGPSSEYKDLSNMFLYNSSMALTFSLGGANSFIQIPIQENLLISISVQVAVQSCLSSSRYLPSFVPPTPTLCDTDRIHQLHLTHGRRTPNTT